MNSDFLPNLQNIVNQTTLKWVFVGGKGGVGKTTISSSLAILLAKSREKVLIISTDPAHNLSDSFNQKLGSTPTKISGINNLYGCEIEAVKPTDKETESLNQILGVNSDPGTTNILNDLMTSVPGIDEAMSLGYIMKIVKELDFTCVVFDTAPTGHTLRLLNFPQIMDKGLEKLLTFREKMGGIVQSLGMLGGANWDQTFDKIFYSISSLKESIEMINQQFKDNSLTTFIAVCIPEFLSMYETERLTQELMKFNIDIRNVVINQLLMNDSTNCDMCKARQKMQNKYTTQIKDLFEDFHITMVPLMPEEIRGVLNLQAFSNILVGGTI